MPGTGHTREDLTARQVKFWSVFSYYVVYDPDSDPIEIITVIHGARDVQQLLKQGCSSPNIALDVIVGTPHDCLMNWLRFP
jgi:hypothetical protein